jgi:hypothetical protein
MTACAFARWIGWKPAEVLRFSLLHLPNVTERLIERNGCFIQSEDKDERGSVLACSFPNKTQ